MKRNSSNLPSSPANTAADSTPIESADSVEWGLDQEQADPVWNILGEASQREPSAFFARNVVRETRLLATTPVTWGSRVAAIFAPRRLALGAAACVCALAVYQMWPAPEAVVAPIEVVMTTPEPSSALSEVVIEEALNAAAEDPTIFTRDEVVAMIGF